MSSPHPQTTHDGFTASFVGGVFVTTGASGVRSFAHAGEVTAAGYVTQILKRAKLYSSTKPRRIAVVKLFNRGTVIPAVSGVLPDPTGVRFRVKDPTQEAGFICLLRNEPGEDETRLFRAVDGARAEIVGETSPEVLPSMDEAVEQVLGVLRGFPSDSKDLAVDLPGFAQVVAEEIGPEEDAGFWFRALCEAENRGRVYRSGKGFHLVHEAPAPPVGTPPPPDVPRTPASPVDEEALSILTGSAGKLAVVIARLQELDKGRRTLFSSRGKAVAELARLDAELVANAAAIKTAAGGLDVDLLGAALSSLS